MEQYERSELGTAIADGDLEYVKTAIATGDDPNCEEEAPLFVATVERQKEIALFLLAVGADPNFPHLPRWSSFPQAVAMNDLEWVEFLTEHGGRVRTDFSDFDQSELHMAAEDGHLEMVQLLVEKAGGGDALEIFDYIDRTPLIAAAQNGCLEVVRYLLSVGSDVNALVQMSRDDKIGDTAISVAVREAQTEMVKFLLENDADPYRPGWMWTNAWDQVGYDDKVDYREIVQALHIPELKRPAQTPHRKQVETQLLADLKFHGYDSACRLDWKATKPVGETFTVRGRALRAFSGLRAYDESGGLVAVGDVDFIVLTKEIDFKAFWSGLTVDGKTLDLPLGVPEHILAQMTREQRSWVVMDRRNYCGRLVREDLDRVR